MDQLIDGRMVANFPGSLAHLVTSRAMSVQLVHSRVKAGQLLACVANALECAGQRVDLAPPEQFLQACVLPLEQGKEIAPHIHAPRAPAPAGDPVITQEGWIVLRGKIRVSLFDLDRTFLQDMELAPGHLIVTFYGGHSMLCVENDTLVVEFKNGPYVGRDFTRFSAQR